ncbi:hypothetical protein [uncultured Neisseria sp.]|uniref:hypothetical protein n=1 Tax=uncultured Neisseria sp. TaxID=237778 RepID=UPI002803B71E|nr:hypothetical protein [uncultured Neisseria sp.]
MLGLQPKLPKGRLKLLFQTASPFSGCPSPRQPETFPPPQTHPPSFPPARE